MKVWLQEFEWKHLYMQTIDVIDQQEDIKHRLIVELSFHTYFLTRSSTWYQCRDLIWILDINLVTRLDIDLKLSQNSSSWLNSSSNRKFRVQLLIEVSRPEFMILLNDIFRVHDSWEYWLLLIEISRAEFMILLIMQQSNCHDELIHRN